MNEKKTKPDIDLSARKEEFLGKFVAFAKQARERLIEKFPDQSFSEHRGFFQQGMKIRLYKDGDFICLGWITEYAGDDIQVLVHDSERIQVEYMINPNIFKTLVNISFEEFTNAFEKLFAELKVEPKKISINVTQEQLDKINEHGII